MTQSRDSEALILSRVRNLTHLDPLILIPYLWV
jgi:hypothetical protein